MGVDIYRFHIKKKISAKVIREAARKSRNIKKEASEFFNAIDPKEIEDVIRTEMSYWHAQNGYMYIDDSVMSLLSLYPYLHRRGYITKPVEVNRPRGGWYKG